MKKKYKSRWEGPGWYRVWRVLASGKLEEVSIYQYETNASWIASAESDGELVCQLVHHKVELPDPPKPVIEFEPGLYRVQCRRKLGKKWVTRERTVDGRILDGDGVWIGDDFDTAYSSYQKLEPGEIVWRWNDDE